PKSLPKYLACHSTLSHSNRVQERSRLKNITEIENRRIPGVRDILCKISDRRMDAGVCELISVKSNRSCRISKNIGAVYYEQRLVRNRCIKLRFHIRL